MKIIVVVRLGLLILVQKMKQLAQCHQADSQYLTTKAPGSSANFVVDAILKVWLLRLFMHRI
jgi:hypothetical protein